MSRLTVRDKAGIVIMTSPQEANNKLAELEDVLEELGIENAEELRVFCKEIKRLKTELPAKVDYIHELVEVKDDYKQQFSKAILPKFEMGQEVWWIPSFNEQIYGIQSFIIEEIIISKYGIRYADECGFMDECDLFASKEEAQAKLDEMRRKENV